MKRKKLTIGLFGFGCVGKGLFEVLQKTPGLHAEIRRICVKDRSKKRQIPAHHFTFDKEDLLNDESINTIVELIDDADAAFVIVKAALKKGKCVVTANKKMVAEHFEELIDLQRRYDVSLLYEAACCASIPIIRNLEEYYNNDMLEVIEGIVNGSTNYILTRIAEDNLPYTEALRDAQRKGYAETNPILDTGGFDAKYKLVILMAHAFGLVTRPEFVFNLGIDRLGAMELNYAREKGLKIKLVAYAERKDGRVKAFVLPKFVQPDDRLYSVDDVFNGVKTKSQFCDVQFMIGKGAGAYPTASAVLSDISALSFDYRYEGVGARDGLPTSGDRLAKDSEVLLKVFLRHTTNQGPECFDRFEEIQESYTNHGSGFVIGTITLKHLKELMDDNKEGLSAVLFDIVDEKAEIAGYHEVFLHLEEAIAL